MKAGVVPTPMISVPKSVLQEYSIKKEIDTMDNSESIASSLPSSISLTPAKSKTSSVLSGLPSCISIQSKTSNSISRNSSDDEQNDTSNMISKLLPNSSVTAKSSANSISVNLPPGITVSSSSSSVSNGGSITVNSYRGISISKKDENLDENSRSPPAKRRKSRSKSPNEVSKSISSGLLSSISLNPVRRDNNSDGESNDTNNTITSLPPGISISQAKSHQSSDEESSNDASQIPGLPKGISLNIRSIKSDNEKPVLPAGITVSSASKVTETERSKYPNLPSGISLKPAGGDSGSDEDKSNDEEESSRLNLPPGISIKSSNKESKSNSESSSLPPGISITHKNDSSTNKEAENKSHISGLPAGISVSSKSVDHEPESQEEESESDESGVPTSKFYKKSNNSKSSISGLPPGISIKSSIQKKDSEEDESESDEGNVRNNSVSGLPPGISLKSANREKSPENESFDRRSIEGLPSGISISSKKRENSPDNESSNRNFVESHPGISITSRNKDENSENVNKDNSSLSNLPPGISITSANQEQSQDTDPDEQTSMPNLPAGISIKSADKARSPDKEESSDGTRSISDLPAGITVKTTRRESRSNDYSLPVRISAEPANKEDSSPSQSGSTSRASSESREENAVPEGMSHSITISSKKGKRKRGRPKGSSSKSSTWSSNSPSSPAPGMNNTSHNDKTNEVLKNVATSLQSNLDAQTMKSETLSTLSKLNSSISFTTSKTSDENEKDAQDQDNSNPNASNKRSFDNETENSNGSLTATLKKMKFIRHGGSVSMDEQLDKQNEINTQNSNSSHSQQTSNQSNMKKSTNETSKSINDQINSSLLSNKNISISMASTMPSLSSTFTSLDNSDSFNRVAPLKPVAEFTESKMDSNSQMKMKSTLTELRPITNLESRNNNNQSKIDGLHQLPTSFESRKAEIYHLEKRLKSLRGMEPGTYKENGRKPFDDELRRVQKDTRRKLKLFGRKELEALVVEQFTEKVLHQHELGLQKQLCERLETTLEATRKKTAQFHKEFEDMKKVTQRLQTEHNLRKSHISAPIRIKRSVGIQAAPSIINKGIAGSQNKSDQNPNQQQNQNQGQQLAPKTPVQTIATAAGMNRLPMTVATVNANQQQLIPSNPTVVQAATNSLQQMGGGQMLLVTGQQSAVMLPRNTGQPTNQVVGLNRLNNPPNQSTMFKAAPGTVFTQRPWVVTQQTRPVAPSQNIAPKPPAPVNNSGIIDLTDDDDTSRTPKSTKSHYNLAPGTPIVIVPANKASSTIYMMARPQQNINASLASSSISSNSSSNTSTPNTSRENTPVQSRHPAPLPRTPIQQMGGSTKKLPPLPILKLSHKDNSIVLSWTMTKTDEHENIASYQLYAYQEGVTPPSSSLWKKVGSVKALELPMACTLTQFMPGHTYHFAVRAVDAKNRLGPFSDAKSIRLYK